MSGRIRLTKWVKLYQKHIFKIRTGKKLEKIIQKEKKLLKKLYESDFHEISY